MQIACPNCNARYLVPDAKIGQGGRRVRCARCDTTWKTEGVPPKPAPEQTAAPNESVAADAAPEAPAAAPHVDPPSRAKPVRVDPVPRDRSPAPIVDRPRRGWMGWAAIGMLVLAVLAAFFLASDQIKSIWPASAKIYKAVGISSDSNAAVTPKAAEGGGESTAAKTPAKKPEPKKKSDSIGLESSKLTHAWAASAAGGYDLKVTGEVTNTASSERADAYIRVRLLDKQGGIVRDKRQLIGGGPFAPGESRSFTIIFSDPDETVAKAIPAIEPAR